MTPTGLCARAFPPLFLVERERERALSVCGKSLPSEKKGGNERERVRSKACGMLLGCRILFHYVQSGGIKMAVYARLAVVLSQIGEVCTMKAIWNGIKVGSLSGDARMNQRRFKQANRCGDCSGGCRGWGLLLGLRTAGG